MVYCATVWESRPSSLTQIAGLGGSEEVFPKVLKEAVEILEKEVVTRATEVASGFEKVFSLHHAFCV